MLDKENVSRMSKVSLPEFDGDNLEEYMDVLYSHQKHCEKEGKYMQADMAKKKLSQMKVELNRQQKEQIFLKHESQKRQVENAHIEEMTQFNKYWDEKMIEYQTQAEKLEEEILQKHEIEMEQFQQEIQQSIGYKQKESGEIINLRKIEESLARQENYIEAHKVQKQIQELERAEFEKWNMTRTNKIRNLLNQLRGKQQNEVNVLRQRIQQGFQEQKQARITQEKKLIQKYLNFIKELENHHRQQILKFDKQVKMQTSMNFSKSKSMSRALQSVNSRN